MKNSFFVNKFIYLFPLCGLGINSCIFHQSKLTTSNHSSNQLLFYHQGTPSSNFHQKTKVYNHQDFTAVKLGLNPKKSQYNIDQLADNHVVKNLVNNLTEQQIKQDIKDALYEITTFNKNVYLDFDNITINFRLKDNAINKQLSNFNLTFYLTNDNNTPLTIFNSSVSISPQSTSKITLYLQQGKIVFDPSETFVNNQESYYLSWNIVPITGKGIRVTTKYLYGDHQGKTITSYPKNFKILTSYSHYWKTRFHDYSKQIGDGDLLRLGNKLISQTSSADFKKDINDYFLVYLRYQMYLWTKDLQTIIHFLLKPTNLPNYLKNPQQTTWLAVFLNLKEDQQKTILEQFGLSPNLSNLAKILLKTPNSSDIKKITQVFKYLLSLNLPQFFNKHLTTKIFWHSDPVLNVVDPYNPTVSFKFVLEIIINKSLTINFQPENGEFDLNQYLGIDQILSYFLPQLSQQSVFNSWKEGVKFKNLTFAAGESVAITYQANHSPISMASYHTFDSDKTILNPFGVKINNLQVSYNFSNLQKLLADLYYSLNQVVWTGASTFWDSIAEIKNKLSQVFNLKNYLSIIDFIFTNPQERNKATQARGNGRKDRPLEKIFDYFINRSFNFHSSTIDLRLTRAFYHLPQQINKIALYNKFFDKKDEKNWRNSPSAIYDGFINQIPQFVKDLLNNSADHLKNTSNKEEIINHFGGFYFGAKETIDAYYANPNFDLALLEANGKQEGDQQNSPNTNAFSLWWKNPKLKAIFDNYTSTINQQSVIFDWVSAQQAIDQQLQRLTNDQSITNLPAEINAILAKNLFNPNLDLPITPEVWLLKLNLTDSFLSLFHNQLSDILTTKKNITPNIFTVLDDAFFRDGYLCFINLKTGLNLVTKAPDPKGILSYFTNSKTMFVKLIPPVFAFDKVKWPARVTTDLIKLLPSQGIGDSGQPKPGKPQDPSEQPPQEDHSCDNTSAITIQSNSCAEFNPIIR